MAADCRQQQSRLLIATLDRQITDAVRKEVAGRIASAEAAFGAVRTIFLQNVIDTREADKREFVFLSQIQAQPSLSWIAFGGRIRVSSRPTNSAIKNSK